MAVASPARSTAAAPGRRRAFTLRVKPGKTYMLRLINAALNDELVGEIKQCDKAAARWMIFSISFYTSYMTWEIVSI
jgi:hypothetical protein